MPETTLSFAKIVATPTSTSWSQSYNAGSLFVVLSLSGDVSGEEGQTLNALGKEFLNTLEAEFFTLEEKSLSAIKQALTDSQSKIPPPLTLSLALVFIKQNIVYGYTVGFGKIIMRRNGQIGTILTNKEGSSSSPRELATSSGILQAKDILVLQTQQFATAITPDVLKQALELDIPNDIAETLSVPIHGTDEGAAAGIVIMFHGASQTYVVDQKKAPVPASPEKVPETPTDPSPSEPAIDTAPPTPITPPLIPESPSTESIESTPTPALEASVPPANSETVPPSPLSDTTITPSQPTELPPVVESPTLPTNPPTTQPETLDAILPTPASDESLAQAEQPVLEPSSMPIDSPVILETKRFSLAAITSLFSKLPLPSLSLSRRQKLGLLLLVVLLVVLGIGIYFATRTEKKTVDTELFNKVYPEAQKDYEEGEGLLSLNKNLARDDFMAAQKKLSQLEGKYEKGSKEEQAISELKKKVDSQLQGSSGVKQADVSDIADSKDVLLSYAKKNPTTPLTQDDSFIYAVSNKAVTRIDKGNNEDKSIITNDDDWENATGIGYYLGNIYILDTKNGVLKFVSSGSDYSSPSSYFSKEATPDTSKGVAMSIDGSIWLLFSDGTINKYTKGVSDNFRVIGLDTPFSKPTKIITNADMTNLYILDPGNKRIVTLDKKGSYLSQVISDTLGTATEMTIDEKNKKARFLSSGKLYEVSL